jgi:hypothetical protein
VAIWDNRVVNHSATFDAYVSGATQVPTLVSLALPTEQLSAASSPR